MLWIWTPPKKFFFKLFFCYIVQLHGKLLLCLAAWMSYKCVLLLHVKKMVPLNKQFIIIIKYTDLSVHIVWENTLKILWTDEERHLEPLVAALHYTLFPSYFSDVWVLDRLSCGEWFSLAGKKKKKKSLHTISNYLDWNYSLYSTPETSNVRQWTGSCKPMRCSS